MAKQTPVVVNNSGLEKNGGTFDDVLLPLPHGKDDFLEVLHGINTNTDYAELGSDLNVFDNNFPAKILPIGDTAMGTMVLMYVGGTPEDGEGQICIQASFSPDFVDFAASFGEFLGLLHFK